MTKKIEYSELIFKWIFISLVFASLNSCNTENRITRIDNRNAMKCIKYSAKYCKQNKDSVLIFKTQIVHDTTISYIITEHFKKDTLSLLISNNKLINSRVSFLNTEFATSEAQIIDNVLYHNLHQLQSKVDITLKNAIQKSIIKSKETYSKPVIQTVKLKYIPLIYKIFSAGFLLLILFQFIKLFVLRK